jgi:hypothetical protein
MKIFFTLVSIVLVCATSFYTQPVVTARTSGSPGGYTGSISENKTCGTNGGCHGGGVTATNGIITTDIPTSGYVAGATYDITINFSQGSKTKYGFEISAENANGIKQGLFTNGSKSKVLGNKNATHVGTGTIFNNGTATWNLQWTAPLTDFGAITFSAVVNASNGNGSVSGDALFMEQKVVSASTVNIVESQIQAIQIYPNPTTDYINFSGLTTKAEVEIFDSVGKQVLRKNVKTDDRINLQQLPNGNYFVKIIDGQFLTTEWIIKQ